MTRIALLLLGLGILPLVHFIEGDNDLLQPAAFILVLVLPFALGAVFYRSELLGALRTPWSSTPLPLGEAQARRTVEILQSLRRLVLAAAVLGIVLAAIHLLGFLDRPAVFPRGIAVTWVAVFYGVFASELLLAPMTRQVVVRSFGVPASPPEGEGSTTTVPLLAVVSLLILSVGFVAATWIAEGGAFAVFLQPVAVLGLLPALLLSFALHSPAAVRQALVSSSIVEASDEALQAHHHVLSSFRTLLYGAAALCHLLGAMHVVLHLSTDAGKFGAGLAISLTPWIYAVILGELVLGRRRHRMETELELRGIGETGLGRDAKTGPGALIFSVLSIAGGLAVIFWAIPHLP